MVNTILTFICAFDFGFLKMLLKYIYIHVYILACTTTHLICLGTRHYILYMSSYTPLLALYAWVHALFALVRTTTHLICFGTRHYTLYVLWYTPHILGLGTQLPYMPWYALHALAHSTTHLIYRYTSLHTLYVLVAQSQLHSTSCITSP